MANSEDQHSADEKSKPLLIFGYLSFLCTNGATRATAMVEMSDQRVIVMVEQRLSGSLVAE